MSICQGVVMKYKGKYFSICILLNKYLMLAKTATWRVTISCRFKRFHSRFTSISFKTTCLQNMSDFAENFLVSICLFKVIM
jgi:hypothetical protein